MDTRVGRRRCFKYFSLSPSSTQQKQREFYSHKSINTATGKNIKFSSLFLTLFFLALHYSSRSQKAESCFPFFSLLYDIDQPPKLLQPTLKKGLLQNRKKSSFFFFSNPRFTPSKNLFFFLSSLTKEPQLACFAAAASYTTNGLRTLFLLRLHLRNPAVCGL